LSRTASTSGTTPATPPSTLSRATMLCSGLCNSCTMLASTGEVCQSVCMPT
jgi:hypothetical protein